MVNNLATFKWRLSEYHILGVSTSWSAWGLSRPVQGQLYLYLYLNIFILVHGDKSYEMYTIKYTDLQKLLSVSKLGRLTSDTQTNKTGNVRIT